MSKLNSGALHKFLTGETVTGDDTQIATNINIAFELLRQAGNDTDDKVNNTYTKAQTDSAFGVRDSAIAQLAIGQIPAVPGAAPIPVSLINSLQAVNNSQASPLDNVSIIGRTLVNLLGRDGNCEDTSKWTISASTLTLDSTNKVLGNSSIKVTISSGTLGTASHTLNLKFGAGAPTYLIVGQLKNGNLSGGGNGAYIQVSDNTAYASSSSIITDSTNFNFAYAKFNGASSANSAIVNIVSKGSVGQYAYFDGIAVYELSASQATAIDSMTATQVAAKYPYVDDVKHINAPYIIKYGANLIPQFNEWTLHANAVVTSPYTLKHVSVGAGEQNSVIVPAVALQDYTFWIGVGNGVQLYALDSSQTQIGSALYSGSQDPVTITTPVGTAYLKVVLYTGASAGTFNFYNPILNLGTTSLSVFKPRNDDALFFPNVQLASSVDGTVYDTLFKRDGKYFIEKRFKDIVLDGSLSWVFGTDYTGFKRVSFPITNAVSSSGTVVKYDGKILNKYISAYDAADISNNDTVNQVVTIADTDSGWGETYTPTAGEIQAYFYGYQMGVDNAGAFATPYTGTGTKKWRGLVGDSGTGATTLPTSQNTLQKTYKLTYPLATPTFEEIQVGDTGMSLHEGLNQIEVGQGVVVREKVNASDVISGFNQINTGTYPLKNRNLKILKVYKNGKDDAWLIGTRASGSGTIATLGNDYAQKLPSAFDPTATYEVSYIALDQYLLSAPVQVVNGETASNLKTVVDLLSANDADQDARISALEINKARKVQGQWIAPTLLNGWVNYGGAQDTCAYMKDDLGYVHVKGVIKSGTIGVPSFTLPIGYRPLLNVNIATLSNDLLGKLLVVSDGTVVCAIGSNVYFSLDNIPPFLAEQ